jgi:LPS sulfotransferase NodH
MFYAQRNLYLTGFTLALAFVLVRHFKLVTETTELHAQLRAVEDQGPDRRRANKAIMEELELLREKSKTSEAALSQAKAQQEEYLRLADRYNELEAKLTPEDPKRK